VKPVLAPLSAIETGVAATLEQSAARQGKTSEPVAARAR